MFSSFSFGFEGMLLVLIVSVPGHCLSVKLSLYMQNVLVT